VGRFHFRRAVEMNFKSGAKRCTAVREVSFLVAADHTDRQRWDVKEPTCRKNTRPLYTCRRCAFVNAMLNLFKAKPAWLTAGHEYFPGGVCFCFGRRCALRRRKGEGLRTVE
jgi:hypothetical protein